MRDALVYAVAVAISPVPIGAILLLLTCPEQAANGLSFLAGWVVGVGTLAVLFVVLVDAAGISDSDPLWIAIPEIVLGVTFLLIAAALWIRRDRRRETAAPWIDAVDQPHRHAIGWPWHRPRRSEPEDRRARARRRAVARGRERGYDDKGRVGCPVHRDRRRGGCHSARRLSRRARTHRVRPAAISRYGSGDARRWCSSCWGS